MDPSGKTHFRKKNHPNSTDSPARIGELGGSGPGEANAAFSPDGDDYSGGEKRSSLTNAILDHFKRNLSSASLKSSRSSSNSLKSKPDGDEIKPVANATHATADSEVKDQQQQQQQQEQESTTPSRTRKIGYVPSGLVNRGFVDDKNAEPFAILCEKSEKKTPRSRWQKQLSTFHSEISHQKFNEQQKRTLRAYSSANYMPAHSVTYVRWMKIHRASWISRLDIDRWFLISLIGVLVGLVASLLKQCIQVLNGAQWRLARSYFTTVSLGAGYAYLAATNAAMVFGGAILVTMFHPMAAGGGAPEVIAFLNGIRVHGTLSVKNLVAKFGANVLAVGSGLPAAIQGPLITYGAIIGAGIGQFQSKPFHFSPNMFRRFRNAEDRRTFTTDGVAAGVSAGFHAPIGGLLFAMEDLSSFWSKGLSWQTFFCSVVATSTAQMFNTAFKGFKYDPPFGFFFWSTVPSIQMHVLIYLPAILLGIVGGLLGALFTRVNVLINQKRKLLLSKIKNIRIQQLVRMLEPCLIVMIMTAYAVFLPLGFRCHTVNSLKRTTIEGSNLTKSFSDIITTQSFTNCPKHENRSDQYFNPMATLIQGGSQGYLDVLWSRKTVKYFDFATCLSAFAIYFPLTIWTAGSAIAGGIFVPILISGSLIGRALGSGLILAHEITTGKTIPTDILAWMDPGILAAVGAGALLSGVNRLEVASTVILVEMVGDINLVLPVLIAIFISKAIANKLSKPLYKYQLEGKALPFLDTDPELVVHGKIVNMELWRARDVMASPVHTIPLAVSVSRVSKMLLETKHNGFPVVKYDEEAKFEVVYGMITRHELYSVLSNEEVYRVYHENSSPDAIIDPKIPYEDMDSEGGANVDRILEMLRSYVMKKDINTKINLELYVNMSVTKVDQNYSLMRTYRLFRTMGLRQLLVTDNRNRPVGIITRKDLMQFNIQEKLEKLIGLEIPEDAPGAGIPRVYSGGNLGGRRMSRRFSVEEGSVLGVVVAQNDGSNGSGDSKDEAVIELPAVTRIRKMETIREEEASSTDVDNSPAESEEHQVENDNSASDDDDVRGNKTSFTVVTMEESLDGAQDTNNNSSSRREDNSGKREIVNQHPHLEQLYLEAIRRSDGFQSGEDEDGPGPTRDGSKPTQRF